MCYEGAFRCYALIFLEWERIDATFCYTEISLNNDAIGKTPNVLITSFTAFLKHLYRFP